MTTKSDALPAVPPPSLCSAVVGKEYLHKYGLSTIRVLAVDADGLDVVNHHPVKGWNNTRRRQSWKTFLKHYLPNTRITND